MAKGQVVEETVESEVLKGNAAGDPWVRRVPIYLPPSYASHPERRYPVVYVLTGFTGRGRMLLNDAAWSPALDDRMDDLIASGRCGELILVMPDAFTRYGGSQYIDSSATGRYGEHLARELVAWVDARYRTLAAREHRGVAGKSSGGYGALVHGMMHPDVFGAVACHSGDMYFDYCYRGDVPRTCSALQQAGGLRPWFEAFEAKVAEEARRPHRAQHPGDGGGLFAQSGRGAVRLRPAVRPRHRGFREDVWGRWLARDPIRLLERHADALRSLRLLHLDCGTRDEWHLHLGARIFARRLTELGIAHQHEEFDDGHMNVSYRYEVSLPRLAGALGAARG